MLDISYIRNHQQDVQEAILYKGKDIDIAHLLQLDDKRRQLQQEVDQRRQARKAEAKHHGAQAKGTADKAAITAAKAAKKELQQLEETLAEVTTEYTELLATVPNMPSEDTPIGKDETENVVIRKWGKTPIFDFTPQPHELLGADLDVIDIERAAAVSGSRFAYLKGDLVLLQLALMQWVMGIVTDETRLQAIITEAELDVVSTPFVPVLPPVFIRPDIMHKMARLEPRDERYHMPTDDLYLIGSAEHTLGPLHYNETLAAADLPLRYIGYSTSFRREAGSYGKDTKGILRVHQFDKLEMESFTPPDQSLAEQKFLVAIQEYFLQQLCLPHQVVLVCTGDMGGPDARQIDIETWMPGQNAYRETHSADLMTDYQSRRLRTKVKLDDGTSPYVHMNDATALALGRTLIAIMENYQQADGSIMVPDVLQPYTSFEKIEKR